MRVLDAHVHLWDRSVHDHPWLAGTTLPARCGLEDLPAVDGGRRVLLVEAACRDDQALDEARWMSALGQRHPTVAGFVANLPFSGEVSRALAELATLPGWCGVRWLFQDRGDLWSDPRTDSALAQVAASGVPFDLCVRHHQLPAAVDLLRRHPGLVVVLDHCGKPPLADPDALTAWSRATTELAALPGVYCKLSGLTAESAGMEAGEALPRFRWALEHCLDTFGAGRCLVGSDWPVSPLLDDSADAWFDLVAQLAGPEADQVLRRTAETIYHPVERTTP